MNNNCYSLEKKIAYITNCEYKYFFNKKSVIGVGMGYKIKNGFYTCIKCIVVFVTKKLSLDKVFACDLVSKLYNGIQTDVVESDIPQTASLTTRQRSVTGGYCIGAKGLTVGTMGCLVGDSRSDYILACNHTVANNQYKKSRVVLQPSPDYGGKMSKDVVGEVSKFILVNPDDDYNDVDAALVLTDRKLASIYKGILTDVVEMGIPKMCSLRRRIRPVLGGYSIGVDGLKAGTIGCLVADNKHDYILTCNHVVAGNRMEKINKVVGTVELTTGTIKTRGTVIIIDFLGRQVTFKNQTTTTKMSDEGDSGSILLNDKNEALGMLMGDNSTISIYNSIIDVVQKLNVHILRN